MPDLHHYPRILSLDSLGSNHPQAVDHLVDYLLAELKHKRGRTNAKPPQLELKAENIPRQTNLVDCGIYLLSYIQEFAKGPEQFVQTLLQGGWPEWRLDPSELRKFWRETIHDSLLLTPEQASEAARFRDELRGCESETERYELCRLKRNQLLDGHTEMQCLFSTCDIIMSTESSTYQRRKKNKDRETEDDSGRWRLFLGIATEGFEIKSRCLTPLKEVARYWGTDIMQHYRWAIKGEKYCVALRAAARQVPEWAEAAKGLNQSIVERSLGVRLRPVQASVNPIELRDIGYLRKRFVPSPGNNLAINVLPDVLGFDKFGLLVLKEFAAVLVQPSGAGSHSSTSPYVDSSDTSAKPLTLASTTRIDVQGTTISQASDPHLVMDVARFAQYVDSSAEVPLRICHNADNVRANTDTDHPKLG
ncbi:hypothetical protein N0V88_000724 [Collariella sp. IMI 366227]|nr:hypothetical protein N0V88_000724 [Collariella sp. IMI 366227]